MRQLHPVVTDGVDVYGVYTADERPPHDDGRPWVLLNLVTSADSATAVGGVSGSLGGEPDKAVFRILRTVPDVILVGAATVRAEGYGPPRLPEEARAARVERGQAAAPRLAVVTASLDLDPTARLFAEAEPGTRPYVIPAEGAAPERLAAIAAVSEEVIVAGRGVVDVDVAVRELGRRGVGVVLCEGGPTLNSQLVAGRLVDELCLTVAPAFALGESARLAHGPPLDPPTPLRLDRALEQDGVLILRYVRS
jgi:riboflavin biosynthesis pyrimidine reductase